jgi:large subunit ribosomal protein L13
MSIVKNKSNKTIRANKNNFQRDWYIIDASKTPVGRLSTEVARILMGKNRADFSPDVDMGGCVVVINADRLVFTGQKMKRKVYFRYTNGRIGSLKHRTVEEQMKVDPTKPIYLAVKRMLPKNRHQDLRVNNRLHIFAGSNHGFTQKLIALN